jgi:2-amino-4-hydroxy-6-hydroxymethyldihydropteridine diphosphokinase/ribosomal-protein-alanine acetyltransferase
MGNNPVNQVFVGLGTNMGNRALNLKSAIDLLAAHPQIRFIDQSSIFENKAIEDAGPEDFLNQVVLFETFLNPYEFLKELQSVEAQLDPDREGRGRKKSRFIDLDILTFADEKINDDLLQVPHPRMQERDFVMNPMNELQTKIYKQRLLIKDGEDPVIKTLAEYSDFTRKLTSSENLLLSKIDEYTTLRDDVCFRRMMLEDLDQVLEIDEAAFGEKHWGRDTFVKELNNQYAHYLVATDKEGNVLGFIGIWLVIDEMHIMTLAIAESARRRGLAEALLILGFKHSYQNKIRTATLEVKANNIAAIKLYDKYLFKQQGLRPKYYADGQAALLLWTEEIYEDKYVENFIDRLEKLLSLRLPGSCEA